MIILAFFFAFLIQVQLFELCLEIPVEPFVRETVYTSLVLAILYVQRSLDSDTLKESLGRVFFIGSLLLFLCGFPGFFIHWILELIQTQLYLLESYHRTHILLLLVPLFFAWIPWAFMYNVVRNSRAIPSYVLPLSTIAAIGTCVANALPNPWMIAGFLLVSGVMVMGALERSAANSSVFVKPIEREIWILVFLCLILISAGMQKEVLAGCCAFFLLFCEGKPGKFWWVKRSEKIFDWAYFHAFLLGSFFLLYPSFTMSTFVVGSMMVCLVVPAMPSRRASLSVLFIILFILTLCSTFNLQNPNQRIVLWHFFLSARLLLFYGSRKSWVAMGLVGFVLYYTVSLIPKDGMILEQYPGGSPRLVTFQDLYRVERHGEVLYKSTSLRSHFEDFFTGKSWIFVNTLDGLEKEDVVRIFDVQKSENSKTLNPLFYYADLEGSISRRKLNHVLRENLPNYLMMNFHRIHHEAEYGEWIRILSPRLSGGVLNFTDQSYRVSKLKSLLEPFAESFPHAKLIVHRDGASFFSGLEPNFRTRKSFRSPVVFSLSQFLHYADGKNSISFPRLKEQLSFLQIEDLLTQSPGVPPDYKTWGSLALYFYHEGMDSVAHRIVRELREWDTLGLDLIYFESLLKGGEPHKSHPDYASFLLDPEWEAGRRGTYLFQIFQEQVFREFPSLLPREPVSRVDMEDSNPWYQMILLLQAKKPREAHQLLIDRVLVPSTPQEKKVIRFLWEELGLPEAASFYR